MYAEGQKINGAQIKLLAASFHCQCSSSSSSSSSFIFRSLAQEVP